MYLYMAARNVSMENPDGPEDFFGDDNTHPRPDRVIPLPCWRADMTRDDD